MSLYLKHHETNSPASVVKLTFELNSESCCKKGKVVEFPIGQAEFAYSTCAEVSVPTVISIGILKIIVNTQNL